jgi:hypothetical protein
MGSDSGVAVVPEHPVFVAVVPLAIPDAMGTIAVMVF